MEISIDTEISSNTKSLSEMLSEMLARIVDRKSEIVLETGNANVETIGDRIGDA